MHDQDFVERLDDQGNKRRVLACPDLPEAHRQAVHGFCDDAQRIDAYPGMIQRALERIQKIKGIPGSELDALAREGNSVIPAPDRRQMNEWLEQHDRPSLFPD
jgi:hypothetical protein